VRYRLMATYQGSPFEAGIGPAEGDIVLFAACPPPEDLGFEPATGHWRKQLRVADVQAVWESRPVGTFRGERCMVLDDLGDRLHIGYLGHDGIKAEQLGYWQVDRGVFELVAPRTEVTEILEERTEYAPPVTGPLPALAAGPGPASYDPAGRSEYATPAERSSGQYPIPARPDSPRTSGQYPTPARPDSPRASGQHPTPARPDSPRASGQYPTPARADSPRATGQYPTPDQADSPRASSQYPTPARPDSARASGSQPSAAYLHVPDSTTGVALPPAAEAPLPLEAEAMRAASARRSRPAARDGGLPMPAPSDLAVEPVPSFDAAGAPASANLSAPPASAPAVMSPGQSIAPAPETASPASAAAHDSPVPARQRRSSQRRMATERLFGDLAALAGIPADSYAVGEAVDGAMCLVQTEHGFEVFHAAAGARHERQVFASEESACFYLFGVLAAEAVRNGSLVRSPVPAGLTAGKPPAL
jgi:hypothetical protein